MKFTIILRSAAAMTLMACVFFTGCRHNQETEISLNGAWQFCTDPAGSFKIREVVTKGEWRTAQSPLSWQAQFADLRDYQGVAWFRKHFKLAQLSEAETVLCHFNAVDYKATVYINGVTAGTHEGGYTPFSFDIRSLVRPGENEIVVRVMDPVLTEEGTEGILYWEIPHGKQNWYVQTSGIWQDASIRIRPRRHIRRVHITPAIDGSIKVGLRFNQAGSPARQENLTIRLLDPQNRPLLTDRLSVSAAETLAHWQGALTSPLLWSPAFPNLYTLQVEHADGRVHCERFGFRSFTARDRYLYLNGEPFYLIAALDQDFYPETVYTTPSREYLLDEMTKAKKLGLNMLRCHIKVPDPLYLEVADEVGLLVWCEIPNWDRFSPASAARGMQTFAEMVERDWNHPSLVIFSLINESWGLDLQQPEQRTWLRTAYEAAKLMVPGRLIVDNSACWGNFHLKTDINDYHTYWAIPENRRRFDETVAEVAGRPDWLFSPFGDGDQSGQEPMILSEFGNWGLPRLPQELPFWFDRDFEGRLVTMPRGILERFESTALRELFGSYDELADASQHAQFAALKYEIEQIRLQPEIQGYVITEFTDINWECNGLLDMWRKPKVYAQDLRAIQQADILIPRPIQYSYWEGERAQIRLWLSRYESAGLDGASVSWRASSVAAGPDNSLQSRVDSAAAAGMLAVPAVARAGVAELAPVSFVLPAVSVPQKVRVDFELRDNRQQLRAVNYTELFLYPRLQTGHTVSLHWAGADDMQKEVAGALIQQGYQVDTTPAAGRVLLTNRLDAETVSNLQAGGLVICFLDETTPLPAAFGLVIKSREEEWLDGNWASNLNFQRRSHPLLMGSAFGPALGFEAAGLPLKSVISGIPGAHARDILAGMFVGWLHLNSGYLVQMQAGAGKLMLCTLPLPGHLDDPFAHQLLQRLITYSESAEYTPSMKWDLQHPI